MKVLNRVFHNKKSAALITLISIMMITSLIAGALASLRATDLIILNNQVDNLRLFYLAESALNDMLVVLRQNPEQLRYRSGRTYAGQLRTFSTGRCWGAWEAISDNLGGFKWGEFKLIGQGLLPLVGAFLKVKEVELNTKLFYPFGHALVCNSFRANHPSEAVLKGDMLYPFSGQPAGIELDVDNGVRSRIHSVDNLATKIPEPDFDSYQRKATFVMNQMLFHFGHTYSGLFYVRGLALIEPHVRINGAIIADRIIVLGVGHNFNPDNFAGLDGYPALVARGQIQFLNGGNSNIDGLVYADSIMVNGNFNFNKGIITKELRLVGHSRTVIDDKIDYVPPFFRYRVTKGSKVDIDLKEWRCN